jgi:hypothetical protein
MEPLRFVTTRMSDIFLVVVVIEKLGTAGKLTDAKKYFCSPYLPSNYSLTINTQHRSCDAIALHFQDSFEW